MITTPTAFPELPDLDKLEALFQARVEPWMAACFGPRISADTTERNHRFIEEALELVQAGGMSKADVLQLVDYTYGRPIGELHQEVGGVMVTLAALCLAQGLDMHDAAEVELARIWTKVEAIRAKQLTKPRGSPLPAPAASLSPLCGAQHAESGKEAAVFANDGTDPDWSSYAAAEVAQQAAAPGSSPEIPDSSTSAPGTPEAPIDDRKGIELWRATLRACGELPEGYEVRIELENGCGMAVWYDAEGERHVIDGEGYLSDDVNEAVDAAIQRAAQLDGGQEGSGS
jgi:hypothetical protein